MKANGILTQKLPLESGLCPCWFRTRLGLGLSCPALEAYTLHASLHLHNCSLPPKSRELFTLPQKAGSHFLKLKGQKLSKATVSVWICSDISSRRPESLPSPGSRP